MEKPEVPYKAFAKGGRQENNTKIKKTDSLLPFPYRHLRSTRGKGAFFLLLFSTGREVQVPLGATCSQLNTQKVKKQKQVTLGKRQIPIGCCELGIDPAPEPEQNPPAERSCLWAVDTKAPPPKGLHWGCSSLQIDEVLLQEISAS